MMTILRNKFKKMKVSIYVSCHKKIKKPFGSFFMHFVEAGRQLHEKPFYKLGDDSGDNISIKNKSYNELTTQYWVWKNDMESDIVGFCHYRRYFKNKRATINKPFFAQALKPKEIKNILKTNDIICRKFDLKMVTKDRIDTSDSTLRTCDIPLVRNIIFSKYGEHDAIAFDEVMNRSWNYLQNMYICSKKLSDEYSSWLFPILEELENNISEDELIGQEKRIYGLWGEYLLSVFIKSRNLKVYECGTIFTEAPFSPWTRLKSKGLLGLFSYIKRKVFNNE